MAQMRRPGPRGGATVTVAHGGASAQSQSYSDGLSQSGVLGDIIAELKRLRQENIVMKKEMAAMRQKLDATAIMAVRTNCNDGSGNEPIYSVAEPELQGLIVDVEEQMRARSMKQGYDDYSHSSRIKSQWGAPSMWDRSDEPGNAPGSE